MSDIKDEILTLISKWWVWILYLVLGMLGKFSDMMRQGNKMTWAEALGTTGLALFVGVLTSLICYYFGAYKLASVLVPLATLLSDKLILVIYSLDYKKFFSDILSYWSDKLKK